MNDPDIRKAFHESVLRPDHSDAQTLVVDELGLEHGKCRADIAVISDRITGYEIKSDVDSLRRLHSQVCTYNGVFDELSLILTECHLDDALQILPGWWGVILARENRSNSIQFEDIRRPKPNPYVSNYAVAQLLWRQEAQDVLANLGMRGARLRERRSALYGFIAEMLTPIELQHTVSEYLRKRRDWRHPVRPFPGDD